MAAHPTLAAQGRNNRVTLLLKSHISTPAPHLPMPHSGATPGGKCFEEDEGGSPQSWPQAAPASVEEEAKAPSSCPTISPGPDARHGEEPDDTPGQLRYLDMGVNTPYISVFSIAEKQTYNRG